MAAKFITIDPMTRLEGALAMHVKVEDQKVTDAWSVGGMYRGMENILLGRDPRDAPVITARTCGVCHNVHRTTSTRAIENAFGLTTKIPKGAVMLRNLETAIEMCYDHAAHTVVLAGPDYSADVLKKDGIDVSKLDPKYQKTAENFNFLTGKIYKEAVMHQRTLNTCIALIGGRASFNHTWVPGGAPRPITVKMAAQILARVLPVQKWVNDVLVPEVLNLKEIMLDVLPEQFQPHKYGKGDNNFLACGALEAPDAPGDPSKFVFSGGAYYKGSEYGFDQANVGETIAHSWYNADMGNNGEPIYMGDEAPPHPDVSAINMDDMAHSDKFPKYTWAKGTRYKVAGQWAPMEVGPLARMVVNRKKFGNPADLRVDENKKASDTAASTYNRIMARVQEALLFVGAPKDSALYGLLGDGLLASFLLALDPKAPTSVPGAPDVVKDGKGWGAWEAPRGFLGHWITVKDKKIALYNYIAATSWNAAPRDHLGQRGPFEASLIGVPVPNDSNGKPILTNIGRTIRSFDPCLACTVHVYDANRKRKYRIDIK